MNRKQITSIILLICAIIYDIIPNDIVPDVPIIGWFDDFFVTSSALFNCIQQFVEDGNDVLVKVIKWLKWTCLLLTVLIILIFILVTATVIKLLQ